MSPPINSADWRKVNEHIEGRLATHQKRLEQVDLDAQTTAVLRGRIAELRALQAWGRTEPGPSTPFNHY